MLKRGSTNQYYNVRNTAEVSSVCSHTGLTRPSDAVNRIPEFTEVKEFVLLLIITGKLCCVVSQRHYS